MAYVAAPPPAPVLPPVTFVQSSAKYWQDLQKHVATLCTSSSSMLESLADQDLRRLEISMGSGSR